MPYYVYMLTNKTNRVLYTGLTGNLTERLRQHRAGQASEFTTKYNAYRLVYYEIFDDIEIAKKREKAVKKWNRAWKEELINAVNPKWDEVAIT